MGGRLAVPESVKECFGRLGVSVSGCLCVCVCGLWA